MTIIQIENNPGHYKLVALGHAGRAEGEDGNLVCAAVSALTQALVQFCRDRSNRIAQYNDLIGDADIFIRACTTRPDPEISGAFALVETGLRMVEKSNPGRIQIVGGESMHTE